MSNSLPTLYKRTSTGKVQQWTITTDGSSYSVTEGIVGGKLTTTQPHTCEPKNTGKANATTGEEQAIKEAQAKWDHKLAHGYARTAGSIDDTGYKEPMLAKQWSDYEDKVELPLYVDPKLNGMRCNALKASVKSRKGKDIHTIPHIVAELKDLFEKYPALFLDGELFNYEYKNNLNRLIELTSVAYKPKDLTPELLEESKRIVQFHVYDGFGYQDIGFDTPFATRREALADLLKGYKYVKVVKTTVINPKDKDKKKAMAEAKAQLMKMLKEAVKQKEEGLIIRWGTAPYEFKRSKYLLKLKNFIDAEFEIEAVQEGNGDWSGCAKRIVLKLPKPVIGRDGVEVTNFASNIEGDREWLRKLFQEKEKVIGELANCEFQEYSEYGIPLIPYVRSIRNYE